MPAKYVPLGCVLIVLADGFEEIETVAILSQLRHAGVCVKSVGLTSGPVGGVNGIWLMPDLTFTDVDPLPESTSISAVIIPECRQQSLARLETDPRVHRLLNHTMARGGRIVVGPDGKRILKIIGDGSTEGKSNVFQASVIFREPGQPPGAFANDLIRLLEPTPRL